MFERGSKHAGMPTEISWGWQEISSSSEKGMTMTSISANPKEDPHGLSKHGRQLIDLTLYTQEYGA